MHAMIKYPALQASLARAALGLGLFWVFASAIPWAEEVAARDRWLQQGLLFETITAPQISVAFSVISLLSLALAAGIFPRALCLLLWLVLLTVRHTIPMFYDFDFDYYGWLLLMFALFPKFDWRTRGSIEIPKLIWVGAWLVLGMGYLGSGLSKAFYPPWLEGGIAEVMLSRGYHFPRYPAEIESITGASFALKVATWTILAGEILFLPMALSSRTRPLTWMVMTAAQIGMGALLILTPLNYAPLVFHILLFDPAWLGRRQ